MDIGRLAVVSNRLPIVLSRKRNGWHMEPGSGGLVTALSPVLRDREGIWIGWIGTIQEDLPRERVLKDLMGKGTRESGFSLRAVPLSRDEVENYYYGFSNAILWPLFHDLISLCQFEPRYWDYYQSVNTKFALTVAQHTTPNDYVWVHDYQLILVGRELAHLGHQRRTGFFLHIPFPPLDIFLKIPWRFEILHALLAYDLLGFQTIRDKRNFIGCVRTLLDFKVSGKGQVNNIQVGDRQVRVGAFPISIDYNEFANLALTPEVADKAWIIHANLPQRQLILGVDRLDYTKGIPQRLHAFGQALERYPEMRGKGTLVQVAVPSRQGVAEYDKLKQEIERMVGEINGKYTEVGWIPIHYIFRSLTRSELVAYYKTCEIALITPLKDGMNLIAKEYCASNIEEKGVLILSEFAGAASQLYQHAVMVNPFDVQGIAEAIHTAFHMDHEERQTRMRKLRRLVQHYDIFFWVDTFLRTAIAKRLEDFPQMEMFVPTSTLNQAMGIH